MSQAPLPSGEEGARSRSEWEGEGDDGSAHPHPSAPTALPPSPAGRGTLDPWLLAKLVCPLTRTPLRLDQGELISDAAGLAYPIRDGVPVMLVEAARPLGAPGAP